jgi:two-component system, sensor histidine kinase and response regulator
MMEGRKGDDTTSATLILVVEDSPTQAKYLTNILEKHGYRIATAANGRKALTVMAGKLPDLIISDVIMPEMDGYELCRRIKADTRYRILPVILLTSLADPQDVIRGLECGADNFISKPYSEDHLLSRITQMGLERRQAREDTTADLEIFFSGKKYSIAADRRQILNFLLSTYEEALQKNRELSKARDELNELNARLEAANQELEAFSYTVSHDLRSPLTGIIGFSEILQQQCAARLDKQCTDYLWHINASATRMNQLIETLLDYSRLTHIKLCREAVNLSRMATSISLELRMHTPARRVTFIIADGVMVNGDAHLLRVVLANLLGNAWKYTGKRDEAVIEFGEVRFVGKKVCFIRDNGSGFAMADADKLFTPFQRLHDSEEFEGHGIGLATVQRIIGCHGGQVWAEGKPGKGATFYFTLPEEGTADTDCNQNEVSAKLK